MFTLTHPECLIKYIIPIYRLFRLLSFYFGKTAWLISGTRDGVALKVSGYVRCNWTRQFKLPPMAGPRPVTCLDRLDVIGRVESFLAGIQATSTPALVVFVLGLGQLVPCEVDESLLLRRRDTWLMLLLVGKA